MAITGYSGKPGHGKSYEVVVYQVYHAVKNRRHVVTNIPLFLENFSKVDSIFEPPIDFVIPDCRSKKDLVLSDEKLQELIVRYQNPLENNEKVVKPQESTPSSNQSTKPQTFQGVMSSGWQPSSDTKVPQLSKFGVFKIKTLGSDQSPPPKEVLSPPKRSITEIETIFKSFLKENPEPAGDTWINPWHYVHFIEDTAEYFAFQTRLHYGGFLEMKLGFSLTTDKGEGPLYVVDEAQRPLPVSDTSSNVENFFQLHRHYGVSIVLITQNFKTISTKIQVLIEDVITLSKNHIFGSPTTYLRFHHAGLGGPFINKQVRSYIAKYFLLYKSYTQGGTGEAGKVDFQSIWSRPSVIIILILLFCSLGFFIYLFLFGPTLTEVVSGKQNDNKQPANKNEKIISDPVSQKTVSTSQLSPPPPPVIPNDPLRVGGFSIHQGGFGSLVLISNSKEKIPSPPKNLATYYLFKDKSSVIQISSSDLTRLGYKIKTELKCFSLLEYKKKDKIDTIEVTCDIPPVNDSMQTVPASGARPSIR